MLESPNKLMVTCDVCEESVPRDQSVLRDGDTRLCWFCFNDDVVDPDPDVDWEDVDWEDEASGDGGDLWDA
jgi:hypothetical protein